MPKLGMEPLRRAALVDATIDCIGRAGSLDVTVSQIARKAGVSSALAHHYFGAKEQIFLAAMRHILKGFADAVRDGLARAQGPRERLEAIIHASFGRDQFRAPVISSWLNLYVAAHSAPEAKRLLSVFQRRLRSNMIHDLRPLVGARAAECADIIGALIDGIYIRVALTDGPVDRKGATALVLQTLDRLVGQGKA